MTSRHDATSIHPAFNYTCPNTSLSSTTILLFWGLSLYHLAHSEGCFVPLGIERICQIHFSLCLEEGRTRICSLSQQHCLSWQVWQLCDKDCPHSCSVSSSSNVVLMHLHPVLLFSAHQSSWTHIPQLLDFQGIPVNGFWVYSCSR